MAPQPPLAIGSTFAAGAGAATVAAQIADAIVIRRMKRAHEIPYSQRVLFALAAFVLLGSAVALIAWEVRLWLRVLEPGELSGNFAS